MTRHLLYTRWLGLSILEQCTKFEVSGFTHPTKGQGPKIEKWVVTLTIPTCTC